MAQVWNDLCGKPGLSIMLCHKCCTNPSSQWTHPPLLRSSAWYHKILMLFCCNLCSRDVINLLGENLLLGERGESEVRLDDAELGEQGLGLLVLDGGVDNDVLTGDPVDRGGDAVLVTGLEGVDDAEDLSGVAAGGGRVGEDGADGLLGVDDEDGSDGEGNALLIDVGSILLVDPVEC
jgi:hypothetical protein